MRPSKAFSPIPFGSRVLLGSLLAALSQVLNPSFIMADENPSAAERWLQQADVAPPFRAPGSLSAWQSQRVELREQLRTLLGKLPSRPAPLKVETVSRENRGEF